MRYEILISNAPRFLNDAALKSAKRKKYSSSAFRISGYGRAREQRIWSSVTETDSKIFVTTAGQYRDDEDGKRPVSPFGVTCASFGLSDCKLTHRSGLLPARSSAVNRIIFQHLQDQIRGTRITREGTLGLRDLFEVSKNIFDCDHRVNRMTHCWRKYEELEDSISSAALQRRFLQVSLVLGVTLRFSFTKEKCSEIPLTHPNAEWKK